MKQEEPKTFKQMDKLTEVDWNKFKKSPFHSKKEPKQETLEEVANKNNGYLLYAKDTKAPIFNEGFIAGYQLAQQQNKNLYSEEEVNNNLKLVIQTNNIETLNVYADGKIEVNGVLTTDNNLIVETLKSIVKKQNL